MAAFIELPPPAGTRFHTVRHVAETGSTNADLMAAASAGAAEGLVLVTDHQTAGRGRQRRNWHDDPGNALLVSALLRPPPAVVGLIPLITGLAAVAALDDLAGGSSGAGLKWPNDVLAPRLDERKLAGILAESVTSGSGRVAVVTGMGMNLRWSSPPPDDVAARAATVTELLDRRVDRDVVLDRYLRALDGALNRSVQRGVGAVLDDYREVCLTLGRRVRFTTSRGEHEGEAVGLTEAGLLVLATDDGRRVELVAGDAHHLPMDSGG